ncbi:MAG: inorganic diphosphatase [Nitrososphaeraceae archaeon]
MIYDINLLKAGINPPHDINVVIEIPKGSNIKYELDPITNILYVDRVLSVEMVYPYNYGFIPKTLESFDLDNKDNLDVFVIGIDSLIPRSVVNCTPLGVFLTEDQDGIDSKIIALPNFIQSDIKLFSNDNKTRKIKNVMTSNYDNYSNNNKNNIDSHIIKKLQHFIEHHKDLEQGKFVQINELKGKEDAEKIILQGIKNYSKKY